MKKSLSILLATALFFSNNSLLLAKTRFPYLPIRVIENTRSEKEFKKQEKEASYRISMKRWLQEMTEANNRPRQAATATASWCVGAKAEPC